MAKDIQAFPLDRDKRRKTRILDKRYTRKNEFEGGQESLPTNLINTRGESVPSDGGEGGEDDRTPMAFTTSTDPAGSAATTAAIIDDFDGVIITLTGAGNAQTLADPSNTDAIRWFMVIADDDNGANTIAVNTKTLSAAEIFLYVWDGDDWTKILSLDALAAGGTALSDGILTDFTYDKYGRVLSTTFITGNHGEILYNDAAPEPVFLAVGTTGHGLTTKGAGANPAWESKTILKIVTKTGAYTLTASDDVVLGNSASAFTLTLPTAVGITGKVYTIKNINTGVVTVDGDGAETIDDAASIALDKHETIDIISDNVEWFII